MERIRDINNIETAIDELDKLSKFTEIIESPDEFFKHMQGHKTELSLVLTAFSIAVVKEDIKVACEKQIPKKPINVDSMYIPELMADRVYGECHNCGKYVSEIAKYCCECGQATDWEEINEGEKAKKAAAGKEE